MLNIENRDNRLEILYNSKVQESYEERTMEVITSYKELIAYIEYGYMIKGKKIYFEELVRYMSKKSFERLEFEDCIFCMELDLDSLDIGIINFSNCVFLKDFKIRRTKASKVRFYKSFFENNLSIAKVSIDEFEFYESVIKNNQALGVFESTFLYISILLNEYTQPIQIYGCKFEKYFMYKTFLEEGGFISILNTEVYGKTDFSGARFSNFQSTQVVFHKQVNFDNVEFKKQPNLSNTEFLESVYLHKAVFFKGVDLSYVNLGSQASLNFFEEKIYENDNISSIKNQETYRVLKNESLRKSDSIKAIEYYKKECEHHYQSLKWQGRDFFNKFILWFEKNVSGYGTSAGMAIAIFFLFNIIIFTFCLDYLMLFDKYVLKGILTVVDDFFKTLIPTISYSKNSIYSYAWLKVLHFVINAILIYEIIKSFRKYSRKL